MYDPMARHLTRQAEVRSSNLLRGRLQLQARELESRGYSMLSRTTTAHATDVSELIGAINSYIEIRKLLAPEIVQDGYSDSLNALSKKLHRLRVVD